jgi:hypothetical protein
MKVPVDELNIIVRLDGLVLIKHPRGALLEQLVTSGTLEIVLRELEAQRRGERVQRGRVR